MGRSGQERQAARRAKLKAENRRQLLVTISSKSLKVLDDACEATGLKRDAMLEQAIELLGAKERQGKPKNSKQTHKPLEGRVMIRGEDGIFR